MAIIQEFSYEKPGNIEETLRLRSKFGDRCRFLAGGTDLINHIKDGLESPDIIIDLKGIESLKRLEISGRTMSVGALITFTDLLESTVVKHHCPLMIQMSETVACAGIRNRATMVGNICSAVPSMDSAPVLLVLDAEIMTQSRTQDKSIPIGQWFKGPRQTALKPDEMVTGLSIPIPEKKHYGLFIKLGRYRGEDLAQAGIGILALEGHEYRVAFCAVDAVPRRSFKIENLLNGRELDEARLKQVGKAIESEIKPISDMRASREYRMHMVKIMMKRGLEAAVAGLNGETVHVNDILGD